MLRSHVAADACTTFANAVSVLTAADPDIEVQFPSDERIRYIIDTMAVYVMQDGCAFEQAVMLKEQNNPEFRFLFDLTIPEHVYYRWRLYSLANEDSLRSWRVEPFCLVEETARSALSSCRSTCLQMLSLMPSVMFGLKARKKYNRLCWTKTVGICWMLV